MDDLYTVNQLNGMTWAITDTSDGSTLCYCDSQGKAAFVCLILNAQDSAARTSTADSAKIN